MLVWIIQLGAIIESARMERAEVIAREHERDRSVTAILPLDVLLVDDAPVLLTGCYDEGLRVYRATPRRPSS
jgi:hypothetical protein